jgi:microcystin-dependent protein
MKNNLFLLVLLVLIGIIILQARNNVLKGVPFKTLAQKVGVISSPADYKMVVTDDQGNLVARDRSYYAIPAGTIVAWSGSLETIPRGWALCNGQAGTPNLQGRFILGYVDPRSATSPDLTKRGLNATGGLEQVKLTVNEMPSHDHGYMKAGLWGGGNRSAASYDSWGQNANWEATGSAGGNQSHENMPPFYVLAYIMKLPDDGQ